ncbi:uncharacterized protein L969DRAFT_617657 [Mixia osmundae IAM 14324]|uniref:Uncharacterized protein n=1 Tax=Mixia osmundae (strain CBS 9802 / IAM 14324 / JCM 22182 / KY 12970) TaxID=764103 RepID=G7E5C1_MIXOS|nr:uncharacterized protein L969DRAFT_617657 [Mixia osmundae IAM 14324]KEI40819.1 hypothetical protein L969DRAFT_617657 [Mixia osmundae IAM 14324]GAA98031.1 hypothetical protein E5Q_04711 [Mixia osmundae IAM 14324]
MHCWSKTEPNRRWTASAARALQLLKPADTHSWHGAAVALGSGCARPVGLQRTPMEPVASTSSSSGDESAQGQRFGARPNGPTNGISSSASAANATDPSSRIPRYGSKFSLEELNGAASHSSAPVYVNGGGYHNYPSRQSASPYNGLQAPYDDLKSLPGGESKSARRSNSVSLSGQQWSAMTPADFRALLASTWRALKRDWDEGRGFRAWILELRTRPNTALRRPFAKSLGRLPAWLIYSTLAVIILFYLRSSGRQARQNTHSEAERWLQQLQIDRVVPRGERRTRALNSYRNPYGFIGLVDPYAGGVFNPSILVLPDTVPLENRIVVVARGSEGIDVVEGDDVRWETVVGCFLLELKRPRLGLPYLARESDLYTLNLPAERKPSYQRCDNKDWNVYIGAEDPRLFITDDGQPLLIYSQTGNAPMICRAIFIIDARVVIPGLKSALKKAGYNPPIQFKNQTDLIREDQSNIEKNWSPFLGDFNELYFHVSLVPQQIYKYVPDLTMRKLLPHSPESNCLTDLLGADLGHTHLHHATPLIRATLCNRGECKPTIHNTVLVGLIHVKYHPEPYLYYERRAVTWNVTSPFEYLSVSPPLTYMGTNQADPIFTVSVVWDHPSSKGGGLGLNHGFLDDRMIISFGVADYGSGYIDVVAGDVLAEHTMCKASTPLW